MAYIIQDTTLSRIAEAIRAKNGTTDKIKVSDMAAMIKAIKAGGDGKEAAIIDRSITEYSNGSVETIGDYAFSHCNALTTVDLPAAASIGNSAFSYCGKLTTVDIPAATSIGVYTFYYCYSIETVVLPAATLIGSQCFSSCDKLTTVDLPAATSIDSYAFGYCSSLTTVDLHAATQIGNYAFDGCTALKALIIRTGQVCSLGADLGYGTDSCYIYVPRALVNDYKAATNWAQYADKFIALEDYTVDGTTTGELDTTKIQ